MNAPHEQHRRLQQWIQKADHDLKAAEWLFGNQDDPLTEIVCFHTHQCAEKYLKGFLVFRSIHFPKTHDLVVLMRRVDEHVKLTIDITEIIPLNRYAVEARYPGDWDAISRDEAEKAIAIARHLRRAIRACLPSESSS